MNEATGQKERQNEMDGEKKRKRENDVIRVKPVHPRPFVWYNILISMLL